MPLNNHAILMLIIKKMTISEVSLSHEAFFTGEFMKKKFQYVEFEPFKEALYSGTIVDDIHIAYIFADSERRYAYTVKWLLDLTNNKNESYRFADILHLVLMHKIQNKVTSRIKIFKA